MIQSLDRGIEILYIIAERTSVGVTELANDMQVNKSTAFRLLQTMEKRNLVQQDPATGKYKLGLGLLRLNEGLLNSIDIINISKPFLKQLMEATHESVHLCTLSNDKVYVVDQVKSTNMMKVSATIGMEEPVHCSSVGKCMMAFLPEEKMKRILDRIEFKPYTHRTITSKEMFLVQLELIRKTGYALDDEELSVGVRCIAAPIYNHKGDVHNSLGISGPASRIRLENVDAYSSKLKETANLISKSLGYKHA